MLIFSIKSGPTFHFQCGKGLRSGNLIGVFSNVCGFGDDDDEASDDAVYFTPDVLTEVYRLTIFKPFAFS